MKFRYLPIIIPAALMLSVIIPLFVFFSRPPVLITVDYAFISLYGQKRIKNEAVLASLSLFRRVRTIAVTDESGDDVLLAAVSEASEKPFCVLFPARFASAARVYHELNEGIPVVILLARSLPDTYPPSFPIQRDNLDDYFIYSDNLDDDFSLIGQIIAIIDGEKNGRVVVFADSAIIRPIRDMINKVLSEIGGNIQISFLNSYMQFSHSTDLSCIILAGSGYEYFEKPADIPIICYSWLDPEFLPLEVALYLDDSPWVQAASAVNMLIAGEKKGLISSRAVLPASGVIDKDLKIKLKKAIRTNAKKGKKNQKTVNEGLTKMR